LCMDGRMEPGGDSRIKLLEVNVIDDLMERIVRIKSTTSSSFLDIPVLEIDLLYSSIGEKTSRHPKQGGVYLKVFGKQDNQTRFPVIP